MPQFEQVQKSADRGGPGAARVADADPVIERLRAFRSVRPPVNGAADGVGVFHRVYLAVTETHARRTGDAAFPGRPAADAVEVRWARRYLSAVDDATAGRRPPDCWRPLFQYRHHPGVRPLQFALAGLHAHVGHDLPRAVVDTCRALGCAPPDLEEEFDRVGDLLGVLEERIHEDLMPGPDLLELADPLTHLLSSWSLERARQAAWSAALVLWRLRDVPLLAREFRKRLDAEAGLVGRCLLTPCR